MIDPWHVSQKREWYPEVPREEVLRGRLERRIARKDARIAALEKRLIELERSIARSVTLEFRVEDAVQRALCNVRMIPVLGTKTTKIEIMTNE